MLAVEGLVKSRQDRSGGNIVTLPGNESMGNAINQFVRGRRLPLRTLQETREALEPTLASLAAQRRTAEDLERLR
jgi:GntR family transcriptional repressor for pyruvate dehydrogenase complex